MKLKLDIDTTTRIPRASMIILGCWPIPKNADRRTYAKQQIWWWFSLLTWFGGEAALVYSICVDFTDIDNIIKVLPELSLLVTQVGKQIICKIFNDSLWELISEYHKFLETASPEELEFLHNELKFVYVFHATFVFGCIVDPTFFTLTPLIDGRQLPAHSKYPWSLDSSLAYGGAYAIQAINAVTLSCMANMDVIFATMLWCIVVRFRYLAPRLRSAQSGMDVRRCAMEQDYLIGQAQQIADICRWMCFVIVVQIFTMVTAGGVLILRQPPFYEIVIYAMMVTDGVVELMLYSWVADNLRTALEDLAYAGFECQWYGKPREMALNIRIVMQRCDNPVTISVAGLLPVISREFFGSIMMTTFSYITTLRAVAN